MGEALLMLLWVAFWLALAIAVGEMLARWRDKEEEARRAAWHKRIDPIKSDMAKQQEMLDRIR